MRVDKDMSRILNLSEPVNFASRIFLKLEACKKLMEFPCSESLLTSTNVSLFPLRKMRDSYIPLSLINSSLFTNHSKWPSQKVHPVHIHQIAPATVSKNLVLDPVYKPANEIEMIPFSHARVGLS